MKNKLFILAVFAVLTVAGCATTTKTTIEGTNDGNFGQNIRIPVKDFETLGLVFTENQVSVADDRSEGQVFTYQALLREAQALGADAIINVVIDKKILTSVFPSGLITTWYGSALAIKYTATLTETGSETVTADGVTTTTTTTSVYFNDEGVTDTRRRSSEPLSRGIRQ
jgi:hypothetical protein